MIKHNPLKIDYFKRTFYILSLKNKSYISLLNKNNIRTSGQAPQYSFLC